MVVHRGTRRLRRGRTALQERQGRHHRARRGARVRPDGGLAGTAGVGACAPPGVTSIVKVRERRSVVGLVVVIEGDTVLFRKRGVLVILGLHWYRAVTKPEVKRPWPGLLQFSRLFETAM